MQSKQVQAIVDTFNAIAGDYEDTVLQGVWHAYCDSGIMTDAFSVNDAKRVNAANIDLEETFALDEINDAVKAFDNGADLDCVQCINAICAICDVEEFFETVNAYE
jgi:hypothetical protein